MSGGRAPAGPAGRPRSIRLSGVGWSLAATISGGVTRAVAGT